MVIPGRKWLFRFLAVFGLPILLLGLFELALRIVDYGYPTSFFIRQPSGAPGVLVENWQFGWRFFPPDLARSPSPVVMEAKKRPGVFRIFLFGESAALGDPRPAYGAGRYLGTLLRNRFPGTEFEVICVAMTAINSHAIVPIARDCARYDGDLWIVYMGNNEYVGPFGPNTVFGPSHVPLAAVRAYLALQTTRTGQWLVQVARKVSGNTVPKGTWGGLGMFHRNQIPPGDPSRDRVSEGFRRNLEEIVDIGKRAGVPILFSSMASNLRDCAPFGSIHNPRLSLEQEEAWERSCQAGASNAALGRWADAAMSYENALQTSPSNAELQFQLGGCRLEMTNLEAAGSSFTLARDFDALPFRADSRLNQAIKQAAQSHVDQAVWFVDSEKVMAQFGRGQIPGRESFYEHVHLNPEGNYRLARAWAETISAHLPDHITRSQTSTWAEAGDCSRQLGLTEWNRSSILSEIMARLREAPYTNQCNHASQLKFLANELDAVKQRCSSNGRDDAQALFEQSIKRRPQDHFLHQNFAEFLEAVGDLALAAAEWQRVCELLPHHHVAYFHAGRLLARLGKCDEAKAFLAMALRLRPDLVEGYLELGKIDTIKGDLSAALKECERARRYRPDDSRIYMLRGQVLAAQGNHPAAMTDLRRAIELRPAYWEAHYLLGVEFALDGRMPDAQAEFQEVVRLRPSYGPAHFNLAVALSKQDHTREAIIEFEETLRLEPAHKQAREYLDALRTAKGERR
jgi:tetratricopeptide (TPR) repeat protein